MQLNSQDKHVLQGLAIAAIGGAATAKLLQSRVRDPLRLIGAVTAARQSLLLLNELRKQVVQRPIEPKALGQWAIVTGCTGGLGEEFVRQLAKRGLNLVLISRSLPKLQNLAMELEDGFGVRCVVLAFDFARSSEAEEEAFYSRELPAVLAAGPIENDIGLLVNNVGIGIDIPIMVEEMDAPEVNDMIRVNCNSMVHMSRIVLPLMRHRGRGAVINVSSYGGRFPYPFGTVYAATKAFDIHFSRTCEREYREFGINVLCITPGLIAGTGLNPLSTGLSAPSTKIIVKGALASLGRGDLAYPYWFHSLIGMLTETFAEDPLNKQIIDALPQRLSSFASVIDVRKASRERIRQKYPTDSRLEWPVGTGPNPQACVDSEWTDMILADELEVRNLPLQSRL